VSRATRAPGNDGWILNGRKHWIGNGHRAGVIVTFAQTPVQRDGATVNKPTAFIIRPDMKGFRTDGMKGFRTDGTVRKLGIRGSTQAELVFEDMFVPDDHVLGVVGKGFRVAVHALNAGRLSLASGCTQATKRLVGEMTRYAEARTQFGGPLASFEITQRKIATLAADAYAADSMVGALAAALDSDETDVALEAACAKVFASDMVWRAADEMVQLAGGRGFVKPWPYERYLRDARINRIFEGANEILRLFVGLNGIQEPAEELKELAGALKNPIRNWVVVSEYAAERVRTALGKRDRFSRELHASLAKHAGFVEKHVAELAALTSQMIRAHKKEILHRQLVVERLADMANEIYARATTIARTQRLIDERGAEETAREIALTDLFCMQSGRRFRALRLELEGDAGEAIDDLRRAVAATVRAEGGYGSGDAVLDVAVPGLPAWGLGREEQTRAGDVAAKREGVGRV
jgi:alkylation response protein AidB-like acyl-CoA dehydrogenase